jgi:hypothetical protein
VPEPAHLVIQPSNEPLVSEAIQGFSLDQRQRPAVILAGIFVRLKERCAGSGLVLQRLHLKLRPMQRKLACILPGESIRRTTE